MAATVPPPCYQLGEQRRQLGGLEGGVASCGCERVGRRNPSVPNTPGTSPAAAAIAATRSPGVLLPLVPVTPTIRSRSLGVVRPAPRRPGPCSGAGRRFRARAGRRPGLAVGRAPPPRPARWPRRGTRGRGGAGPARAAKTPPGHDRLGVVGDRRDVHVGRPGGSSRSGAARAREPHVCLTSLGGMPRRVTSRAAIRPKAGAATSVAQKVAFGSSTQTTMTRRGSGNWQVSGEPGGVDGRRVAAAGRLLGRTGLAGRAGSRPAWRALPVPSSITASSMDATVRATSSGMTRTGGRGPERRHRAALGVAGLEHQRRLHQQLPPLAMAA